MLCFCIDYYKLMRDSVSQVLRDDEFSLPLQPAMDARSCAESFMEWISKHDNLLSATEFAKQLASSLCGCFSTSKSARISREKMWESYYKLCSSDEFKDKWVKIIGSKATPIFYQFITDKMMEALIKCHYTVEQSAAVTPVTPLDYKEMNACGTWEAMLFDPSKKRY